MSRRSPNPWVDDDAKDVVVAEVPTAASRMPTLRPALTGTHLRTVLARGGYRCVYCGRRADTRDHVVPRSRGGANTADNLVAACKRCNNAKGDKLLQEWRREGEDHDDT